MALISLSLAIVNLLPFLPLDGGHIFWALVEKVRGRGVTVQTMERASMVGIALIGALFRDRTQQRHQQHRPWETLRR